MTYAELERRMHGNIIQNWHLIFSRQLCQRQASPTNSSCSIMNTSRGSELERFVRVPSTYTRMCEYECAQARMCASTVWRFHQLCSTAVPGVFVLCAVGYLLPHDVLIRTPSRQRSSRVFIEEGHQFCGHKTEQGNEKQIISETTQQSCSKRKKKCRHAGIGLLTAKTTTSLKEESRIKQTEEGLLGWDINRQCHERLKETKRNE